MKGQTEELIWIVIIALSVIFLSGFFYYQLGTRGSEVKKTVENVILDEAGTLTLITLFNNRLSLLEKYYIQGAIDAISQAKLLKDKPNQVLYGKAVGKLNNTETISDYLDKVFGNRWNLVVETPDGLAIYGHAIAENEVIYSYQFTIPVPEERFGLATLKIGRPK